MYLQRKYGSGRILPWLALLGVLQLACADPTTVGSVPPSTFEFTPVVPYTGPGPGGWKVAQVLVLLGRISRLFPEAATCDIEVGVPEVNWKGVVTDSFAQVSAATASDKAARITFRKRLPTALVCDHFRKEMEQILGHPKTGLIPGATVTRFKTLGVPRRSFP